MHRFRFRTILIVNGCFSALFTFFTALLMPTTPVYVIILVLFTAGLFRSLQFSSLTTLAFTDTPASQTTAANTLYSTIQQMSTGMGIAMGAVVLRFSNIINHGIAGHYTIPDFRLAFIFVTVLGFVHLYGYTKLSKDAQAVSVMLKKYFETVFYRSISLNNLQIMNIKIRQEQIFDYKLVDDLVEYAFKKCKKRSYRTSISRSFAQIGCFYSELSFSSRG